VRYFEEAVAIFAVWHTACTIEIKVNQIVLSKSRLGKGMNSLEYASWLYTCLPALCRKRILLIFAGDCHVTLDIGFFGGSTHCGRVWVYGNLLGGSGDCANFVFPLPGLVRGEFGHGAGTAKRLVAFTRVKLKKFMPFTQPENDPRTPCLVQGFFRFHMPSITAETSGVTSVK